MTERCGQLAIAEQKVKQVRQKLMQNHKDSRSGVGRCGVRFPSLAIPKDFKNGIHIFPAWRSAYKG